MLNSTIHNMKIVQLKPSRIVVDKIKAKVIFDYMDIAIESPHGDLYYFLSTEDTVIEVDHQTKTILNTQARFAFRKSGHIFAIPLHLLARFKDFDKHFQEVSRAIDEKYVKTYNYQPPFAASAMTLTNMSPSLTASVTSRTSEPPSLDMIHFAKQMELIKMEYLIDEALDKQDEEAFLELSRKRNELANELNEMELV